MRLAALGVGGRGGRAAAAAAGRLLHCRFMKAMSGLRLRDLSQNVKFENDFGTQAVGQQHTLNYELCRSLKFVSTRMTSEMHFRMWHKFPYLPAAGPDRLPIFLKNDSRWP